MVASCDPTAGGLEEACNESNEAPGEGSRKAGLHDGEWRGRRIGMESNDEPDGTDCAERHCADHDPSRHLGQAP
jgi:hypothetical protein